MRILYFVFSLMVVSSAMATDQENNEYSLINRNFNAVSAIDLPKDVYPLIFTNLDHKTLLSLASTCSQFYFTLKSEPRYFEHMIHNLTKHGLYPYTQAYIKLEPETEKADLEAVTQLNYLKSLSLYGNKMSHPHLLSNFTSLTSLSLGESLGEKLLGFGDIQLIAESTNLVSLSLFNVILEDGWREGDLRKLTKLTKLQTLSLYRCSYSFLDISHFTNLTSLDMSFKSGTMGEVENNHLKCLRLMPLKRLQFQFNSMFVAHLPFEGMQDLISLDISCCNLGSNNASPLSNLRLIEHLNISYNCLTSEGASFLRTLTSLKRLNIMDNCLTVGGASFLSTLTNLKGLLLNSASQFSCKEPKVNVLGSEDMEYLARLPKIEVLSICQFPDWDILPEFSSSLQVFYCKYAYGSKWEKLQASFPNLVKGCSGILYRFDDES